MEALVYSFSVAAAGEGPDNDGDTQLHLDDALDFKPLFHDFALDTFTEMALGVDLQTIGSTRYHPFQQVLADTGSATPLRLTSPLWLWNLEQWLNVGYERKLKHGMENVYGSKYTEIQLLSRHLVSHASRDEVKAVMASS